MTFEEFINSLSDRGVTWTEVGEFHRKYSMRDGRTLSFTEVRFLGIRPGQFGSPDTHYVVTRNAVLGHLHTVTRVPFNRDHDVVEWTSANKDRPLAL